MEVAGVSTTKATKILNLRKKDKIEIADLATATGATTTFWDNLLETGRISLEKPQTGGASSIDSSSNEVEMLKDKLERMEAQYHAQLDERDCRIKEYERERSNRVRFGIDEYEFMRKVKRRELEERMGKEMEEWDHTMNRRRSQEIGDEMRWEMYKSSSKSMGHPFDDKPLLDAHPKDGIYSSGPSRLLGQEVRRKDTSLQPTSNTNLPVGVKREPMGRIDTTPQTDGHHTHEKNESHHTHDVAHGRRRKKKKDGKSHHRYSDEDSSSMSSSSSSSSSESLNSNSGSSDESMERDRRGKDTRHRQRNSPPGPKLPMFSGDSTNWDAFLYLFNGTAKHYHWGSHQKLRRLKECMRDKAINYVRTRSRKDRHDYHRLMKCLKNRFGMKEDSSVVRRNLHDIKQEANESLEDYADRVQHAVSLGYKGAGDRAIDKWATELFLKGAREKGAALAVSERQPRSVRKALKEMKSSISNQKAVLGRTLSVSARQVAFEDEVLVRTTYASPENDGRHTKRPIEDKCQEPVGSGNNNKDKEDSRIDEILRRLIQVEKSLDRERLTPPMNSQPQFRRYGRSPNRYQSPDRMQSPGRGQSPSFNGRCYNCGETGHMSRSCTQNRSRSPSSASGNARNDSMPLKE